MSDLVHMRECVRYRHANWIPEAGVHPEGWVPRWLAQLPLHYGMREVFPMYVLVSVQQMPPS